MNFFEWIYLLFFNTNKFWTRYLLNLILFKMLMRLINIKVVDRDGRRESIGRKAQPDEGEPHQQSHGCERGPHQREEQ